MQNNHVNRRDINLQEKYILILPFSVIDLKHSCLPIPGAYRIKGRFVYKLNNKLIEGIYVDMQETTYKVNLRSYMTCISMNCNNIICISNVCLFKRKHTKPSESDLHIPSNITKTLFCYKI